MTQEQGYYLEQFEKMVIRHPLNKLRAELANIWNCDPEELTGTVRHNLQEAQRAVPYLNIMWGALSHKELEADIQS